MTTVTYRGDDVIATITLNIDALKERARTAARRGIDETHAKCVEMSKRLVRVDTATLQGAIRFIPAEGRGAKVTGQFGAYGVDYAIYQEIGPVTGTRIWAYTPYLRPARDSEYPRLAERVKSHFARLK